MQARYYTDKVQQIKDTLPRVNRDPMELLRKAHERWIPVGGRSEFHLRDTNTGEVIKIIRDLKKQSCQWD